MIAEDQCEQANGPGIERVEDSPVLLITLGHVAVARDVEVVRPIPAVPDFQPAMESDWLLVLPNCVGNPTDNQHQGLDGGSARPRTSLCATGRFATLQRYLRQVSYSEHSLDRSVRRT